MRLHQLNQDEKAAAMAHYIELNRIPLKKIREHLTEEEILRLAPHMRYVDLRGFEDTVLANTFLKNCSNLNRLFFDNGQVIEGITELPFCQKLDCSKSKNLAHLPKLPLCEELDCYQCTGLTHLPELPLCRRLDCSKCTNLIQLPELPLCEMLSCGRTPIPQLPKLPRCQELYCRDCPRLTQLPELPLCKILYCYRCPLKQLPRLLLCQTLSCWQCPLDHLPPLPLCQELDCSECLHLTQLPELPLCEILDCDRCPLNYLPVLPLCKKLSCSGCPIAQLPALPLCQEVDCCNCTNLIQLPALPLCRKLECFNCPHLHQLPVFLWNTMAYSSLESTQLRIDAEKFHTEPVTVLHQLGQYLLNQKPFPNLSYFLNGVRNDVQDCDWLRNDCVKRICSNLFKTNPIGNEKNHFLKRLDGVPNLIVGNAAEMQAYQTLGNLVAHCYVDGSPLKTGPLFNEFVYACLKTFGDPDSWFLHHFLKGKFPSNKIDFLINSHETTPRFSSYELETLADLIDPYDPDFSRYTQRDVETKQETFRSLLLQRAMENKALLPIFWMAQEMKRRLGEQTWSTLQTQSAKAIKEKVEGIAEQHPSIIEQMD